VFGGLFSFILIVVLSFYLSVQENGITHFLRMITPRAHEEYVIDLWTRSQEKIGRWMQGQLILVVIIGVITYLGLLLIGVEHAMLLAFLAGIAELIPLFGPVIAAIPAVIIAFSGGGTTLALVVLAFYLIVQQFENHLIYPLVVRKVVGLSPIIIILALVAGGQLAGFLGVLLSVPLAAILMEFLNDYERSGKGKRLMKPRTRSAAPTSTSKL
jgi:predicted PurR-regulated permease PerM